MRAISTSRSRSRSRSGPDVAPGPTWDNEMTLLGDGADGTMPGAGGRTALGHFLGRLGGPKGGHRRHHVLQTLDLIGLTIHDM